MKTAGFVERHIVADLIEHRLLVDDEPLAARVDFQDDGLGCARGLAYAALIEAAIAFPFLLYYWSFS